MPVPTLSTARLVLRQIERADAAALYPVLSDDEVMTWWSSGPHRSLEETEIYVGRNAAQDGPWSCWAITRDGGNAHGWVLLIEKRAGVAELGYILGRDHWGKGYAREAVSAVIDHGFGAMGFRRIYADTDPANAASIALLKSLGFTLEGHLRGEWETHIGVRDSLIFGLLTDEWRH